MPRKLSTKDSQQEKSKDDRSRLWTFITYPDSQPDNWRDILDKIHIQWIESPLHDADLNADGEQKKAHRHIFLLFEGKKSFEQIKEISDSVNAPIPQKVSSARGLVRYMIHLDNPEKQQYKASEIIGHGGADVAEYLRTSMSTRYELISEMMDWIDNENCIEFAYITQYARFNRRDDWFPLLCDNSAIIIKEYIKSCRHITYNGGVVSGQRNSHEHDGRGSSVRESD